MLSRSTATAVVGLLFVAACCMFSFRHLLWRTTMGFSSSLAHDRRTTLESNPVGSTTARQWLPKLIYNGLSTTKLVENMTDNDADINYYNYLFHLDYICEDYIRLGNVIDGGWDICVVPPYQPSRPCLVYSFGINYDFTFDDAMSRKFGCTVRAFDPSMDRAKDHRRDDNIWFYKIGLGGKNSTTPLGWKMQTLETVVDMLNDTGKIIDYLKMDIDNAEWAAFETMFESRVLGRVKQFGLEIHTMPVGTTIAKLFFQHWKTLKRLEMLGFRRWYWHFNHYGLYQYQRRGRSCCYELVYINTRFLSKAPSAAAVVTAPAIS